MKLRKGFILLGMLLCGACSNAGNGTIADPGEEAPATAPMPSAPEASPQATILQPGDYDKTIQVGAETRFYILHVPANYDGSKALPLIYILHGFGGSAKSMVKLTDLSEKADEQNFFVAYLQGTVGTTGMGPGWNSGVFPETEISVDDTGFVRQLTQDLESQLKVDAKRIYAAGFSNGAVMSYRLGTDLSDILAGIGVVEGTIGNSRDGEVTYSMIPPAQGPIPVVIIHGLQDHNVEY